MQTRIVRSLILGSVVATLLAVGPVAAKISYFSIEVSPSEPVDGDVVVIVVRMWEDAGHTQPATWWPPEPTVEGLVELQGLTDRIPITLIQVDDATYRAEVTLAAGTWQVVPFPRAGGGQLVGATGPGYPAPMTVTVSSGMPAPATAALAAGGVLSLVTVGLIVARPMRRRLERRRMQAR